MKSWPGNDISACHLRHRLTLRVQKQSFYAKAPARRVVGAGLCGGDSALSIRGFRPSQNCEMTDVLAPADAANRARRFSRRKAPAENLPLNTTKKWSANGRAEWRLLVEVRTARPSDVPIGKKNALEGGLHSPPSTVSVRWISASRQPGLASTLLPQKPGPFSSRFGFRFEVLSISRSCMHSDCRRGLAEYASSWEPAVNRRQCGPRPDHRGKDSVDRITAGLLDPQAVWSLIPLGLEPRLFSQPAGALQNNGAGQRRIGVDGLTSGGAAQPPVHTPTRDHAD